MVLTNDQYLALSKLQKWHRKYQDQFIEVSGVIGTGIWDLVQEFIEHTNLDPREVMYLSYDQRQVLDLAFKQYHAYYIDSIIYNYTRIVDFNTLPVINYLSREVKYTWKKEVRKKVDEKYKLMVVFDSTLLNYSTIRDLSSFGVPVILIRDPMLLPAPDTYTFLRDPNIELYDIHDEYLKSPIVYFAHKVLNREQISPGNYDTVSVIPTRQVNLYNLRSSDMNITISDELKDEINSLYRKKILKRKDIINIPGERVIVASTLYNNKLTNSDNKKVKVFLTKGTVGVLTKVNKHVVGTKYIGVDFLPDFYHEAFTDLMMDRHYLNKIDQPSQQLIPDEIIKFDYAYALTAAMSRVSHWDKVTIVVDHNEEYSSELQQRLLYTAITRANRSLTIII